MTAVLFLPDTVKELLRRLEQAGFEAWAVGGCVRDTLLQKKPQDYDICTAAKPEQIKQVFAGYQTVDTGIRHGTVSVITKTGKIEITTYRGESGYSDGRHPDSVRFLLDIKEDLARRDFTINAMAYHPDRGICDPFGGMEDLQRGCIRCVGEAKQRFSEDALRILRALRFSSQLGFTLEKHTAAALEAEKKKLKLVSAERITEELCKLLLGNYAEQVLNRYAKVLLPIFPEIRSCIGFCQYSCYHHLDVWQHIAASVGAAKPVLAVRLALFFHDIGKPKCFTRDEKGIGHFYGHPQISRKMAEAMCARLRLPAQLEEQVLLLVKQHDRPIELTERSIKRLLMRYGEDTFFLLLEVKRGDAAAHHPSIVADRLHQLDEIKKMAHQILDTEPCLSLRSLAVHGEDLKQIGIEPSPKMGQVLQKLLELVVDGQLENKRESLLQAARNLDL